MKAHHTGAIRREHAVQYECVDMEIEIEGSPEPLNHRHRAATPVRFAAVARASAQQAEHGADEHGDDRATQVVVPRQLVTKPVRQTEHPLHPSAAAAPGTPALPHRNVGEHVIEQVGGSLGHPAAAATGTDRAALARKRDQPVEATVAAAKPREPAGE